MATASTDYSDLFSIAGRTALVTGASSGLGRSFAIFLASQGANVIAGARRAEKLTALVEEIDGMRAQSSGVRPGRARALRLDVSQGEPAVGAALAEAAGWFGRIDILVNNAGVFRGGSCLEISAEEFDEVMATNVRGVWMASKLVGRLMAADGRGGNIINVSSITGTRCIIRGESVYGMSKMAVMACTKHMARELGPLNIRVNGIAPGVFPSEMTEGTVSSSAMTEAVAQKLPTKKWGDTANDLMGVLLLLASERASRYLCGEVITVDGGHALVTPDLEEWPPGTFP